MVLTAVEYHLAEEEATFDDDFVLTQLMAILAPEVCVLHRRASSDTEAQIKDRPRR
jgi:hypothetical protein